MKLRRYVFGMPETDSYDYAGFTPEVLSHVHRFLTEVLKRYAGARECRYKPEQDHTHNLDFPHEVATFILLSN